MSPHITITPRQRITTRSWTKRLVPSEKLREIVDLPMVAQILDTIDAHPAHVFVLLAPVQVFKTAAGQLRCARSLMVEPRNSLWYSQVEAAVDEFADSKFNPLFDSVPELMALTDNNRNKRTRSRVIMPHGRGLQLLSANVLLNRNSKSTTDLYLDESWTYSPGAIKEIQDRRADAPWDFRELHMTTGPTAGSEADQIWQDSSRLIWHMRCTECSKLFAPEFGHPDEPGGLRYDPKHLHLDDGDAVPDWAAFASSIRLHCPHCDHGYKDTERARAALNAVGAFEAQNPSPKPRHIGWRVHGIACRSWIELVQEWIDANRLKRQGIFEPLENIVRKRFAQVWDVNSHMNASKLRPVGPTPYAMAEDWDGEATDKANRPWRFCTVDVQQDHFVLVIRMWSLTGESRLRWAEKVTTPGRIHDLCREHRVIPERVFLDARHEPQQTRRMAAQFGWRVMMGDASNNGQRDYLHAHDRIRRIYSEAKVLDPFIGTIHAGRGAVAQFHFSKAAASDRLHLIRTLKLGNTDAPLWTAAQDAPAWYWKEIDGHYRVRVMQSDGSVRYEWRGRKDDHAADCETMGIVVASMAGIIGSESLETPDAPPSVDAPALKE